MNQTPQLINFDYQSLDSFKEILLDLEISYDHFPEGAYFYWTNENKFSDILLSEKFFEKNNQIGKMIEYLLNEIKIPINRYQEISQLFIHSVINNNMFKFNDFNQNNLDENN